MRYDHLKCMKDDILPKMTTVLKSKQIYCKADNIVDGQKCAECSMQPFILV